MAAGSVYDKLSVGPWLPRRRSNAWDSAAQTHLPPAPGVTHPAGWARRAPVGSCQHRSERAADTQLHWRRLLFWKRRPGLRWGPGVFRGVFSHVRGCCIVPHSARAVWLMPCVSAPGPWPCALPGRLRPAGQRPSPHHDPGCGLLRRPGGVGALPPRFLGGDARQVGRWETQVGGPRPSQ